MPDCLSYKLERQEIIQDAKSNNCCTELVEEVRRRRAQLEVRGCKSPELSRPRSSSVRNLDTTTVDGSRPTNAHLSTQSWSPIAVKHPYCPGSKTEAQWDEFFSVVRKEAMWGRAPSVPNRSSGKER